MNLDNHGDKVTFLTRNEWFLIVIRVTADWASLLLDSFCTLESFKALEARSVIDVSATRDSLFIELEIFEANWTWLIVIRTFKEFRLYLLPLCVAAGLWWFFDKSKSFSETQLIDILHTFLLYIIVCALLSLLAHH